MAPKRRSQTGEEVTDSLLLTMILLGMGQAVLMASASRGQMLEGTSCAKVRN